MSKVRKIHLSLNKHKLIQKLRLTEMINSVGRYMLWRNEKALRKQQLVVFYLLLSHSFACWFVIFFEKIMVS